MYKLAHHTFSACLFMLLSIRKRNFYYKYLFVVVYVTQRKSAQGPRDVQVQLVVVLR